MTVDLTASRDACQPFSLCNHDEPVFWLNPRGQERPGNGPGLLRSLLRLTSSLGLGACLTVATASAAIAPAVAAGKDTLSAPEPQIVLPPPAPVDLPDAEVTGTIRIAMLPPARPDPLEDIVPVRAADTREARADIITSMPLTTAPDVRPQDEKDRTAAREQEHVTFDTMRVPRWIVDTILRASEETGVDPVYMMALADKESSFLPENRAATSSAEGLFQFISSTWFEAIRSFGTKYGFDVEAKAIQSNGGQLSVPEGPMREHILGLRRNPYVSALMAAEMMKRDRAKIEGRLGRKIKQSEFYMAHFFGVDSASKFIALLDDKPKQSATRVFPAAAKANKSLFSAKSGRKTRQLSVAEVYGKIDEMIDKRLSRYEDVSTTVAASDLDL
ncbi:transglycosylase SLT domain-containing protein [Microvirga sp. 17 mud 1-3]|uniref:transglycosylase SLT domain-containing protein n=1 Tax=Microvirga sp. 17 mud 1-3 TaxID=2082949 RepID=UPI000D6BAC94|nr:transglycosylase SLT domain-containing protein [Microvirga sp. 17 mud 1-3]AWM88259.1 lytic transglycosylase [Microvirga sp. 17 mud 1-3]